MIEIPTIQPHAIAPFFSIPSLPSRIYLISAQTVLKEKIQNFCCGKYQESVTSFDFSVYPVTFKIMVAGPSNFPNNSAAQVQVVEEEITSSIDDNTTLFGCSNTITCLPLKL